ncbi:cupin domain-containing protein [Clostridium pasteurianum]|uniref:Cupin domain-containing protein n=1 Tax=Clostridium pasteurianum BC1 TaxID=86416 RepID=R4KH58_CLOPA|nr:cupin domain-containing protein [Clostridium pasteurianum]AGK98950.1 cupin domain-containing protein [Clostridium pasteurianum BC1]
MIIINKEIPAKDLGEGFGRKLLASGGNMMAAEMIIKKGAVGAYHSHPHEQISYVVSGSIEATIGGEKYILNTGDSYYAKPNLPHGATALEDSVLLEIFSPQREDFLK